MGNYLTQRGKINDIQIKNRKQQTKSIRNF